MLHTHRLAPVAPFRIRVNANGRGDARAVTAILGECLRRQGFHCHEAPTVPAAGGVAAAERDAAVLTASRHHDSTDRLSRALADLIIVLDEELLDQPETLAGLDDDGILLVATEKPPQEIRQRLGRYAGTVATVRNTDLAVEHGADWAAPVLGAVARVTGFVDPDCLCPTVWAAYDREFPYLAHAAIRACDAGYRAVQY